MQSLTGAPARSRMSGLSRTTDIRIIGRSTRPRRRTTSLWFWPFWPFVALRRPAPACVAGPRRAPAAWLPGPTRLLCRDHAPDEPRGVGRPYGFRSADGRARPSPLWEAAQSAREEILSSRGSRGGARPRSSRRSGASPLRRAMVTIVIVPNRPRVWTRRSSSSSDARAPRSCGQRRAARLFVVGPPV